MSEDQPKDWKVGDIENGHILVANGWVPLRPKAADGGSRWEPGDVVNGHAFTGSEWVAVPPVNAAQPPMPNPIASGSAPGWWARRSPLAKIAIGFGAFIVFSGFVSALNDNDTTTADDSKGTKSSPSLKNGRPIEADYEVHLDADRAVRIQIDAEYEVGSSVEDAASGKADVWTKVVGTIRFTNLSKDRSIKVGDGGDHNVEAFIKSPVCDKIGGTLKNTPRYCTRDIINVQMALLDPGEDKVSTLTGRTRQTLHHLAEIPEGNVEAVKTGIRDATLVATMRGQFLKSDYDKFNPTCGYSNWVTFWSENKKVTTCSTEK